MKERLQHLIPEFNLIGDPALREKVLQVWIVAMERGHWTPATLVQMPFTLLINPCPTNIVEHVRAVTLTALRSAEVFERVYGTRVPIDHDLLVAGALLHDVGKLLEYEHRPDGTTAQTRYGRLVRHPISGAALAAEFGLPEDVVHIIAAHSGEGDKLRRTPEATLINKADFMSFECLRDLQPSKDVTAKLG